MHVDVSQYAVGETVAQEDEIDELTVIDYTSKKMTAAEQIATASDRELLPLVNGLQRFRCYLECSIFMATTDNEVVSHL